MGAASRCVDKKQALLYDNSIKYPLLLGEGKRFSGFAGRGELSMKKKSLWILAALVLVAAAGVGFYFLRPGGGNQVSTGPKKVIQAMMTCPNEDLFTEDMMSVIGEGVTPDPEKLQEAMEDWDDAAEEWEEEVGKYFAPNCLDSFLNDSVASSYLVKGVPVRVEKMELLERQKEDSFGSEKVQVTVNVDGVQETVTLDFSLDGDGKITFVKLAA